MQKFERLTAGLVGIVMLTSVWAMPALARVPPHQMCLTAANQAARKTGVPLTVLLAIARTESGKSVEGTVQPWPWTINTRGTGAWKTSRAELLDHALINLANGETSFDVGCFQINYRWHADNFNSLDEMIDPTANARYAADFLQELFNEFGNWTDAAGAYHSRTEVYAQKYKAKFLDNLATVTDADGRTRPLLVRERVNTFPLLKSSDGTGVRGSLVPSSTAATASLFGSARP